MPVKWLLTTNFDDYGPQEWAPVGAAMFTPRQLFRKGNIPDVQIPTWGRLRTNRSELQNAKAYCDVVKPAIVE